MAEVEARDARRALARLRRAMGGEAWTWDEVESYMSGVLSSDYDGDEVAWLTRGDPDETSAGEGEAAARLGDFLRQEAERRRP